MEQRIPELANLFAIPNAQKFGGATKEQKIFTIQKLKREGLKKGVPDLMMAIPKGGFSGMFIEMKANNNKTSDEQDEWIARLSKAGYKVAVCYGFEEAKQTILEYLEVEE